MQSLEGEILIAGPRNGELTSTAATDVQPDEDDFLSFNMRKRPRQQDKWQKPRKKRRHIKIHISTTKVGSTNTGSPSSSPSSTDWKNPKRVTADNNVATPALLDEEDDHDEDDDELSFFEETHEEQDPAYQALLLKLEQEAVQKKLKAMDEEDQKNRRLIERVISDHMKEKQGAVEANLEKYKQSAAAEEKRELQRVQASYQQKVSSNQLKISGAVKELQRRHQKSIEAAMQRHRQQAEQRRLPEPVATAEWQAASQQIQAKQRQDIQKLSQKGEILKRKTEEEYKTEQDKIKKQYEARLQEIESNRQKVMSKLYASLQQTRQRYLKRHLQNIMQRKEKLLNPTGSSSGIERFSSDLHRSMSVKDVAKSTMEERIELNPPSPIKSFQEWVEDPQVLKCGGAARHNHRKGVLSQLGRHLSIEIHNEGIWVAAPSANKLDESTNSASQAKADSSSTEEEYIPWGMKSYTLLEHVVCGELPPGLEKLCLDEAATAQGGQIRCVITDLRTSEDSASSQRALAVREQEESNLADQEKKVTGLNTLALEAEKAAKRMEAEEKECTTAAEASASELAKAKRMQDEFITQFRNYLAPDGTPLATANPNDRQELLKASAQYKKNLDAATRRDKAAKQKLADVKEKLQKAHLATKTAQKNATLASNTLKKKKAMLSSLKCGRGSKFTKQSEAAETELASMRVKEVISSFKRTADRRRDQFNQKKSSSFSSAWVQSFPALSISLKKSLWHKMHRRKQQIILRPIEECVLDALKEEISASSPDKKSNRLQQKTSAENELVKAEQQFLLACHPVTDTSLASVPPSKTNENWAEPGWLVDLSVPEEIHVGSILPRRKCYPILEKNLAEFSSAPGRQAASIIRTTGFRCLASPLSTFAVASSPAESNLSLSHINSVSSDGDPLNVSTEIVSIGYSFSTKSLPSKPAPQRKKPTAKDKPQPDKTSRPPPTSEPSQAATEKGDRPNDTTAKAANARKLSSPKSQKPKISAAAGVQVAQNIPQPKFNMDPQSQRPPIASQYKGVGPENPVNPTQSHFNIFAQQPGQNSFPGQPQVPGSFGVQPPGAGSFPVQQQGGGNFQGHQGQGSYQGHPGQQQGQANYPSQQIPQPHMMSSHNQVPSPRHQHPITGFHPDIQQMRQFYSPLGHGNRTPSGQLQSPNTGQPDGNRGVMMHNSSESSRQGTSHGNDPFFPLK